MLVPFLIGGSRQSDRIFDGSGGTDTLLLLTYNFIYRRRKSTWNLKVLLHISALFGQSYHKILEEDYAWQRRENQLIDVNKYIGVPYKVQGRSIAEGLDCIGLALCIFEDEGVSLPNSDGFEIKRNWFKKDPDRFLRALQGIGEPIDISEVKRYDIVYFAINFNIVSHAAVMLDNETFIHSLQKRGCFISKLDRYWLKKVRGARRLPEIACLQTD